MVQTGLSSGDFWPAIRRQFGKVHLVHVNFPVACADLTPQPGLEATEARFFGRDALPEAMHAGHEVRVPQCFACLSGDPFFDPADSATMTLGNDQRPPSP
jgi:hypothetical protein